MRPISTRRLRNRLQQEALVQASAFGEVFVNAQLTLGITEARLYARYLLEAADDSERGGPLPAARGPRPEGTPRTEEAIRAGRDGMSLRYCRSCNLGDHLKHQPEKCQCPEWHPGDPIPDPPGPADDWFRSD